MRARKVTIKDVATQAGVSIALVSFVMSNKAGGKETYKVNKETAQRILDVADKLNYQPNSAARTLRSGRSRTIGVILSDISNKFFADIARCIEDRAYKYKYTVLFGSTDENPRKLENLIDVFIDKGVDGLIVVPCEGADAVIRKVAQQRIPLVLLDREVSDIETSSVVLNNCKAGAQITEALVKRGFSRIEMVSYAMQLSNSREREKGYRSCMEAFGLDEYIRTHHLRHDKLHLIAEVVNDAAQRGVQAFLFATNTLAINGMMAISKGGWRIPQDFAVACFDSNEAFDIYDTTVACVRQPIERFGVEALDLLIKHIEEKDILPSCTRVVLSPEIVESESAASGVLPPPSSPEARTSESVAVFD